MVSPPLRSIPAVIQGQYGKQDDDGMDGTKYANITTFSAALAAKNKHNGLKEIAPRGGKKTALQTANKCPKRKADTIIPPSSKPLFGGYYVGRKLHPH